MDMGITVIRCGYGDHGEVGVEMRGTIGIELAIEAAAPPSAEDEPYRKLAAAVISAAVTDFGGWPWRRASNDRAVSGKASSLAYRLQVINTRIEAGRFLVERDDEITRFWFTLAGLDQRAAHRHEPWIHRLAALRAVEVELRRRFELEAARNERRRRRGDRRVRGVL